MTYTSVLASNITSSTVSSSYLSIGSGATAPVNGVSYTTGPTSTFSSPYITTLSSNPGLVTWTFNFRWNRPSANNPATPVSGAYGTAIALAGSSSTLTTGNGYAIVYGSTGTPDPIRLVAYSGGITGTLTNICSSGVSDLAATNNFVSVRVVYDPATNNWSLFVRDDGASAWADPSSGVTTQKGTTTAKLHSTGVGLPSFGFLWSHATGTNLSSDFDNFTVTVAQPSIIVTGGPLSFSNTSVGSASAEQTYTVSGSNLTANLVVTAPSTDFKVSTTSGSGFGPSVSLTPSSGTVATTTIFVRFTPQSSGLKSGNITNATTGATTQNVAVSGTGTASSPTDHFRSTVGGGDWDSPSKWETSPTGSSPWIPATLVPTTSANAITITPSSGVDVTTNVSADQVVIQSTGGLNIKTGGTFTIADDTGTDLTQVAGGTLAVEDAGQLVNNGQTDMAGIVSRSNGGSITGTNSLSYSGASSKLLYNFTLGSGGATSNDVEFPAVNGPANLHVFVVDAPVTLHASRTVTGALTLETGVLATGSNTLTLGPNATSPRNSGAPFSNHTTAMSLAICKGHLPRLGH